MNTDQIFKYREDCCTLEYCYCDYTVYYIFVNPHLLEIHAEKCIDSLR